MNEELIAALRFCDGGECDGCCRYKKEHGAECYTLLRDAADAIEELSMRLHGDEAAIAGMKREIERMVRAEKPYWVSVVERLPENCADVLAYIERNAWGDKDAPYRKREIAIGYHVNGLWHVDGCSGVDCIAWMPLPQPSEYQKEEA